MTSEIIFRPEANYKVGFGHAFRLMALAEYLKDRFLSQFHCVQLPPELKHFFKEKQTSFLDFREQREHLDWVSQNPGKVLVLDGYNFTDTEIWHYKKHCRAIVKIDDLFRSHAAYDLIVNHSPDATPEQYRDGEYTLALGIKYLLVRKAFMADLNPQTIVAPPEKVFICFGASDPSGITKRLVGTLSKVSQIKELHTLSAFKKGIHPKVVLHRGLNEHEMIRLMRSCDLAICAPSTISLEVCCVGLPLIVIQTASNQTGIKSGLIREKAALSILVDEIETKLPETISTLTDDYLKRMVFNQKKMIDGNAASRFIELFEQL